VERGLRTAPFEHVEATRLGGVDAEVYALAPSAWRCVGHMISMMMTTTVTEEEEEEEDAGGDDDDYTDDR
jgi:hypothetical protein